MRKIKKGDDVIILAGRSKGKRGKVLRIVEHGQKAFVEGVNLVKKHVKPNPDKQIKGGITERESPIAIANVAIYNPITKRGDRVGFKVLESGKKVRYFKSTNELVEI
jgi:large subunit ribosomal protein L24